MSRNDADEEGLLDRCGQEPEAKLLSYCEGTNTKTTCSPSERGDVKWLTSRCRDALSPAAPHAATPSFSRLIAVHSSCRSTG